nr:MAG TPA: hypothetical protein [Crassvirales sp.]
MEVISSLDIMENYILIIKEDVKFKICTTNISMNIMYLI